MPFRKKMDTKIAIDAMINGNFVLVFDFYSTGLLVLKALKQYLDKQHKQNTFSQQRDYRSEYNTLSNRLLVSISNNQLKVKKSPEIGWFKELYSDLTDYLLPFPKVQGLNSAWQWYTKGINIPGLNKSIHPFYDTYFPTRFEHLDLFNDWLENATISKKMAFDIGVGSGVLTFQLLQHRFEKVIATDTNPNAIIGMEKAMSAAKMDTSLVDLHYGNLFANCNNIADLIVFNPPWVPINHDIKGIDKAIYYDKHLFPEFFKEASKRLSKNGRLVLIFSNLAEVTKVTTQNPIELELLTNSRFEKDQLLTRSVSKASNNTKRNQNWRKDELVQLWVLKLKS